MILVVLNLKRSVDGRWSPPRFYLFTRQVACANINVPILGSLPCPTVPVRLRPAVGCRVFSPSVLEYFKESFYPFGMAPIGDDLVPLL